MFSVPFASAMNDEDVAHLTSTLNLETHLHPKLQPSPTSPGAVRLDFDSGLFLVHGANEGEWALEGRTWGDPPPLAVHEWHLSAVIAARQLDPTVALPPPTVGAVTAHHDAPVARAENRRAPHDGSDVQS